MDDVAHRLDSKERIPCKKTAVAHTTAEFILTAATQSFSDGTNRGDEAVVHKDHNRDLELRSKLVQVQAPHNKVLASAWVVHSKELAWVAHSKVQVVHSMAQASVPGSKSELERSSMLLLERSSNRCLCYA